MNQFAKKQISIFVMGLVCALGGGVLVSFSCQKKSSPEVKTIGSRVPMYNCPMHPTYISDKQGKCPICGMDLVAMHQNEQGSSGPNTDGNARSENTHAIKIDPTVIQNIGVQTEPAQMRPLQREVRATASIREDERKIYSVSTKIMGYVEKLYANYTGQALKKGQPLYALYSPDLITAQEEYLRTYKNIQKVKQGGIPGAELNDILRSSQKRLMNWDISESEIQALQTRGTVERTLTFYSPVNGIVTEKNLIEGQSIEPGMKLFTIVDYSDVWVIFSLYQQDLPFVHAGQRAEVDIDFYPGTVFKGSITYIAPQLDAESRTIPGRIELVNTRDLKLKPGMFATVRILSNTRRTAVLSIPEQSVIHSGKRTLVILSKGNGFFEPCDVETGIAAEGFIEITKGLAEGDVIVVSSQFLIDSESNLRAAVMSMRSVDTAGEPQPAAEAPSNEPMRTTTSPSGGSHDVYTCPMHPEVVSDKPGDCPKCGMHLVIKKQSRTNKPAKKLSGDTPKNRYICTMCPEIVSDKPGDCPKCGMHLVVATPDAGGSQGTAKVKSEAPVRD
jgi:RND family efflux transporter MFP subunit